MASMVERPVETILTTGHDVAREHVISKPADKYLLKELAAGVEHT